MIFELLRLSVGVITLCVHVLLARAGVEISVNKKLAGRDYDDVRNCHLLSESLLLHH